MTVIFYIEITLVFSKKLLQLRIENSGFVKTCDENVQIRGEILNNGRMEVH